MDAMNTAVGQWNKAAMDLADVKLLQVIGVLAVLRSLSTANGIRKAISASGRRRHYMDTLLATFFFRHGGSFLTALFITHKAPGWMSNPASLLGLCISWYLVFCLPGRQRVADVLGSRWWKVIDYFSASVSKIHCVASWGVHTAMASPNPAIAASPLAGFVAGTLVGCGGGVLGRWLRVKEGDGVSWPPPDCASETSSSAQSSVFFTVVYMVVCDPYHLFLSEPLLSKEMAIGAMVALDIAITAAQDYTGSNYYVQASRALRALLHIPDTVGCDDAEADAADGTPAVVTINDKFFARDSDSTADSTPSEPARTPTNGDWTVSPRVVGPVDWDHAPETATRTSKRVRKRKSGRASSRQRRRH